MAGINPLFLCSCLFTGIDYLHPDLASNYPELLPEWDDEVDPASVLPGSHRQIRWKCPRGHSYTAMPYARVRGTGCPYCANRKVLAGFNDLAT